MTTELWLWAELNASPLCTLTYDTVNPMKKLGTASVLDSFGQECALTQSTDSFDVARKRTQTRERSEQAAFCPDDPQ